MAMESGPEGSGPLVALAALVATMGVLLVKMIGKITGRPPKNGGADKVACVAIQKDIESIKSGMATITGTLKDHTSTHHDIYEKIESQGRELATIKGRMER